MPLPSFIRTAFGLLSCAWLAAALPANAKPSEASPPQTGKTSHREQIDVFGYRTEDLARIVRTIVSTAKHHQVARWNGPVCPSIGGFKPLYRDILLRHLHALAQELDVDMPTQCQFPNVLIQVTDHADEAANALINRSPPLVQSISDLPASNRNFEPPSQNEIDALRVPRAVRWFATDHIGLAPDSHLVEPNTPIARAFNGATVVASDATSMLHEITVEGIEQMVIIIDIDRCTGVPMDRLADYVAMVTFAHPRLDAAFPEESILSLFRTDHGSTPPPNTLSSLDRAVLHALYTAPPDQIADDEYAGIAGEVARQLRASP